MRKDADETPPPPNNNNNYKKKKKNFELLTNPNSSPKGMLLHMLISVHHGFSDRKNRLLTIPIHLKALL
jgi:hypothetical protein